MAATREQIIAVLERRYPDHVIYPETYTVKKVGAFYHFGIHALARKSRQTPAQWIQENGFIWRETGYVEQDMLLCDSPFKAETPVSLADSVMRIYPLVGAYEPTQEEADSLFSSAQQTVRKLCVPGSRVTAAEELVLTLSTIQLAKLWSGEIKDEEGISFWQYIYLQYGFQPENSPAAEQRVYAGFRKAIRATFLRYRRYFAPETTQRYYTSLMLHAIAPIQSIENLLDILFDFYIKNLDFQVLPDDPIYRTLVQGMQARWSETGSPDDNVQLRSITVMSGLKTLFMERPGFMAYTCKTLIQGIDCLLRGKIPEKDNRWTTLLNEWFEKKGKTERRKLQGQRREHKDEYIATTSDRIYVQYTLEEARVGLVVPRIGICQDSCQ